MSGESEPVPADKAGLASRSAALAVVERVLNKRQSLDQAVSAIGTGLEPRERSYAAFLARTVLRRLLEIDKAVDGCLDKPLPRKAWQVRNILRLGVAQLLFSATAPHAAVSSAVDLCRTVNQEAYAKLTNAVLRRIQRSIGKPPPAAHRGRINTPDWLWRPWSEAFGPETAAEIAEAHLSPPPVDLTVKSDADTWAERLGGQTVMGDTVRLNNVSDVTALPGFDDGEWWVQDAAARLPVASLGDVAGKRVFDLCAAPGGKTMQLAAAGAYVTAVDISENRLARLRENLERTGLEADIVCHDVRTWNVDEAADIVVLDAPCSASGTLRRHPDIAHLRSADDVAKLAAVQDALLAKAAGLVRPGGTLLYVTCSLHPSECEERVEAFLANQENFARTPFELPPTVPSMVTTETGDLRTLPCYLSEIGGMDGFYAARLRRTDS